jgi:hypothetical protein
MNGGVESAPAERHGSFTPITEECVMRIIRTRFASLLLLAMTVALPMTAWAINVKILPGQVTNILQRASAQVTLVSGEKDWLGGNTTVYYFRRVQPDGSLTGTCKESDRSGCYLPPAGSVLVITDISWRNEGLASYATSPLSLEVLPPGSGDYTKLFVDTGTADVMGVAGGNQHLTTGLVIRSTMQALRASFRELGFPNGGTIILQGYLAPDR